MENTQSVVLLQCTRIGRNHSYPIDLIIDSEYGKTLDCYEHTSSNPNDFNKVPFDITDLEGELLEIDAIKCDHQCDCTSIIEQLTKHLQKFQIYLNNNSLEYLKDIAWPSKELKLRCTLDSLSGDINFLSPTSYKPKRYK